MVSVHDAQEIPEDFPALKQEHIQTTLHFTANQEAMITMIAA